MGIELGDLADMHERITIERRIGDVVLAHKSRRFVFCNTGFANNREITGDMIGK